jgi:hypothetical protein
VLTFDWQLDALSAVERFSNERPCFLSAPIGGPEVTGLVDGADGPRAVFEARAYTTQEFSRVDGERIGPRVSIAPSLSCCRLEKVVAVAGDGHGRFVFIWERSLPGNLNEFVGQLYSRDGQALGARFAVSARPSARLGPSSASFDDEGVLLVTWERDGKVLLRRFQFDR